jgi:hypothetical protein
MPPFTVKDGRPKREHSISRTTPSAFGEKRIAEIALNTANSAEVLARVTRSLAVEDSFT